MAHWDIAQAGQKPDEVVKALSLYWPAAFLGEDWARSAARPLAQVVQCLHCTEHLMPRGL